MEGSGSKPKGCFLVLCGGGGRWSSRLSAELGRGVGLLTWPWQADGRWGGLASAAVARGKNNQGRTAASLSATKREIKLMSPPAKTCSPGPLAPATNCSMSVCQSNLNACESPQRGLILTSSSAEKNIQAGVWEGRSSCSGAPAGDGIRGLLPLQWLDLGSLPPNLVQPRLGEHPVRVPRAPRACSLKSGG